MDKKTKEALDVIERIKLPNGVIYEVIGKEKRSTLFSFWNIILDSVRYVTQDQQIFISACL